MLNADQLNTLKWYVDTALAVHANFKSCTGMAMTMDQAAMLSMSQNQKLNAKSSMTSELVVIDDARTMMLWTKLFMEELGDKIDKNILYQDSKSAILLGNNGRESAGKQSCSNRILSKAQILLVL